MSNNLPAYPHEDDSHYNTSNKPWYAKLADRIPALGFAILVIVVLWGLFHLFVLIKPWLLSLVDVKPTRPETVMQRSATDTPARPTISTEQATTHKPATSAPTQVLRSVTPADLVVQILDIGVINPVTGQFVNTAPASPSDIGAVRFKIVNNGGTTASDWYFHAELPTALAGSSYDSPLQGPLGPDDYTISTLRFSPVMSGGGPFSVIIDSRGGVKESNEANNTDSVIVPMVAYQQY